MSLLSQTPTTLKLPTTGILGSQPQIPNPTGATYTSLTLSQVGTGFAITNGLYNGWCVDYLGKPEATVFTAYDSYGGVNGDTNPPLPSNIVLSGQTPWNEVNWLINHTKGNNNDLPGASVTEVQDAIWTLLDPSYPGLNDFITDSLLSEAATYGANFVPGPGQFQAVVLYVDGIQNGPIQNIMIPVPVPTPPVTLACPANSGQINVPYSSALVATGGLPPFTFSITAGGLPPGLTLTASTGAISGTPNTPGTYAFTAQVVDSSGQPQGTATVNCSITIPPPPLTLTCPKLTTGTVGVPYSSALTASGGAPPYTFSITSGTLPPGLTLNASTGAITGTPTQAGTFNFTAKVVDSSGLSTTANCSIVISPSQITLSCPAGTAELGVIYNSFLHTTGGQLPFTFSIIAGSLPPGLTLNTATGQITGTPTTGGTYNFTAKVVDSSGLPTGTATVNCSITVPVPPIPPDVFEVNYFINLNTGATFASHPVQGAPNVSGATGPEEYLDIVNPGTAGADQVSETNGIGDLCAMIYVVDVNEEIQECCGCLVTPDQLTEIPVQANLLSNPNNPIVLHNGVIKIIKSAPQTGGVCDPANPIPTPTLRAWITHVRVLPSNSGPPSTPATLGVTESYFIPAALSAGEQSTLSKTCSIIESQSSGSGICSCPTPLPK